MPEPMAPGAGGSLARIRGCLLGGAVGDALGAEPEFMTLEEILEAFGPAGVRDYAEAYGRRGAITDDTQMTLFSAEGLLRAWVRQATRGGTSALPVVRHAYLRWLLTQGMAPRTGEVGRDGWLFAEQALRLLLAADWMAMGEQMANAPAGSVLMVDPQSPASLLTALRGLQQGGGSQG